jgi:uroporphyrinogen III methyltransferase/synthase
MVHVEKGTVYLVGAGPGDPGLITLRGLECLRQADLVLYDGLVNPLLLRHARGRCERTARTTDASGQVVPQSEINTRLIAAAREGLTVVRLKGGDPFIFGRGSEEAAALVEAGIPFEVVPGVTAATAAGVYAGISLTHRDHTSAVAFITGHEMPGKAASAVDYGVLAAFPGTLVFYMGLHRVEAIVSALMAAGKPGATPSCVISRATTPSQRTVSAPLAELPAAVRNAGLHAPSLIMVGECVAQRERLAWFEKRPLFGQTIGITRPDGQADGAIARCLSLGAQPVLLPTIRILPVEEWSAVDAAIARIDDYDWLIFTSTNGVDAFLGRLWEKGRDARALSSAKLAAIGPATAESLERWRLRCDIVPDEYRAEALAAALKPIVNGKRVLWVRASRGRDVLPTELEAAGASVEQLVVYQNVDVASYAVLESDMLESGAVDWIALSSPSIARNLVTLLTPAARAHLGTRTKLAAISPVTAEAATRAGLPIDAVATEYTWEGLFDAIVRATAASWSV